MNDQPTTPESSTPPSPTTQSDLALYVRLVVDDAVSAIDFYKAAFGATELVRFTDPGGKIVHAEIQIGADVVSLSESDGEVNRSPSQLGGSPVITVLTSPDVDRIAELMIANGGTAIFPVADREYGPRDGRYADPEGHLWLLSQHGEDLTPEQIQERLDE